MFSFIDRLRRIEIAGFQVPRVFGWKADPPDVRDLPFELSGIGDGVTPQREIDLTPHFKEISDQLHLPSCVGNATADLWEAAQSIWKDVPPDKVPHLSRMFVWWGARNLMYPNRAGTVCGTYNRLAMDVVARYGVCTEQRWPYSDRLSTVRPSIMSFREASTNRCDKFYCVGDRGSARVSAVVKALSARHPVLFGTLVGESFPHHRGPGVVGVPTDKLVGGHAMVICGYSKIRNAFRVRNSWSRNWGDDGYFWMSPEYLMWSKTKSLWVPTRGAL